MNKLSSPKKLPGLLKNRCQAPVVQNAHNAIHWIINFYPVDSALVTQSSG